MVNRVFISKPSSETQELADFLKEKDKSLVAHSFLQFKPVPFSIETSFDVVFFGSPRAVTFFKAACSIAKDVQVACVGKKTAEILERLGYTVSFMGKKSGNISEVGEQFKEWVGDRSILFPISNISLRSISSLFPPKQAHEVIIYETSITGVQIEPCSTYIFTSPSNAEGFLSSNSLSEDATVIAWGESTANYLEEQSVKVDTTLSDPSLKAVIELLDN